MPSGDRCSDLLDGMRHKGKPIGLRNVLLYRRCLISTNKPNPSFRVKLYSSYPLTPRTPSTPLYKIVRNTGP